jgi:hypothetical protein
MFDLFQSYENNVLRFELSPFSLIFIVFYTEFFNKHNYVSSMEQSPAWEAEIRSVIQDVVRLLCSLSLSQEAPALFFTEPDIAAHTLHSPSPVPVRSIASTKSQLPVHLAR